MTKAAIVLFSTWANRGRNPSGIWGIRKGNRKRQPVTDAPPPPGNQNPNQTAATTIASTSLKQWSQNPYQVDSCSSKRPN